MRELFYRLKGLFKKKQKGGLTGEAHNVVNKVKAERERNRSQL
jgi:hypothetical protein